MSTAAHTCWAACCTWAQPLDDSGYASGIFTAGAVVLWRLQYHTHMRGACYVLPTLPFGRQMPGVIRSYDT